MGGIDVMDLGQERQPEAVGDAGQPVEDLPDLGLHHEAARTSLLDDVADRIEADDADAPRGEKGRAIR